MHPNPAFRRTPTEESLAFVRARSFGTLVLSSPVEGGGVPLAAHVPFVVSDDGAVAAFHLVRSNPIVRVVSSGPASALLAVSGPDAYVSPDWYGLGPDQVPTWNYVAAHLRGPVRLLDPDALRPHLDALSEALETRLAPKPPWRVEKMSTDAYERLARQIVPAEMSIEALDATWKLNQNKPAEAIEAASRAIEDSPIGSAPTAIGRLMRGE